MIVFFFKWGHISCIFPYDLNASAVCKVRAKCGLEVGNCCQFVPLDRLFAEVKVFESERDAAQKVVFTQWLSTEHAQLQLPQSKRFFAVAAVHQLRKQEREESSEHLIFDNTEYIIYGLQLPPLFSLLCKYFQIAISIVIQQKTQETDHLIEGGVSSFPGDLRLSFGGLVWIWKQVGFHIWVGICSIFRNL